MPKSPEHYRELSMQYAVMHHGNPKPNVITKRAARTAKQRRRLIAEGVPASQWKHAKNFRPKREKKPLVYAQYIKSAKWFRFRDKIFTTRGAICHDCGHVSENNHLHHLTYDRLGREKPKDVVILCDGCHGKRHAQPGNLWDVA